MPDFLVSAATGALSPVLRKLGALLSDEYKRYKGLHGEVESLRKDLEAMHAFLLDKSEEENPNEQDTVLMMTHRRNQMASSPNARSYSNWTRPRPAVGLPRRLKS
jgi:hypothetical protein